MYRKTMLACALAALVTAIGLADAQEPIPNRRSAAQKLYNDGNFREAYEILQKIAIDSDNDPRLVGRDLDLAVQSLLRLGRIDEIDEFREQVIAAHSQNWRLLQTAARSYMSVMHDGYIVAGEFHRGYQQGGGEYANAFARDRVRALQLMQAARPLVENQSDANDLSSFYLQFAQHLVQGRSGTAAWQLQYLTDLSELPDYEQGYPRYYRPWPGGSRGAPVDADGDPVFHYRPESFESARTDGERWRWLLDQAVQKNPHRKDEVRTIFADFLHGQFGVRTMRGDFGIWPMMREEDDESPDESGPYALHTLDQTETIARLATGIKRFSLPDEFNFVRIYQQIAADSETHYARNALERLATLFEDRRQYPKAADYWREDIRRFGSNRNKEQRLDQIVGNWGSFENVTVQPARKGATVEFRFRNGTKIDFEAHRIKIGKLLADVKAYVKSNPQRLDWQKMNIANIGYRLIQDDRKTYLGERAANWTVDLKPREDHFDRRVTVSTPLQEAGAYLLTGKMQDGNTSRIVIWVSDTVIVKKPLNGAAYYFVADAVTGRPIAKANLEFFGYRQKSIGRNRYQVLTSNFAEFTDADGQVVPDRKLMETKYQWIVTARTDSGRLAYLGFSPVWYGHRHDAVYNRTKAFVITDRPVYRPEHAVKFKVWVRNARYDDDVSRYANRTYKVRITNPKGESVFEESLRTDDYGGFDGEFQVPADATLGRYHIALVDGGASGGTSFRVEEYKKPEFEVVVEAPDKPVALGEKITATLRAQYYFGAPVTEARVHYKVLRSNYTDHWYPLGLWDWFYGPGYWWFGYDYEWYPGWYQWGCVRPHPFWWPSRQAPPEVVLDNEVDIGSDGTVEIEIDTELAKALHGDVDHQYTITAEVVDQSRRTIVGSGQVLVSRKPFKVFGWTDRGYYRVGDNIRASFQAQTLDRKPIEGDGTLTLYRVAYDEQARPVETEVRTWDLDTNDRGEATQQIKASQAGQYRLSYTVIDAAGHAIEGGYVFVVMGEGFDGSQFRFNDIELITDRREYKPGDKVRLLINTNRLGATVALFLRPMNGVYPRPIILRLDGKSTVHELDVVSKDMPNFFIEAFTVSDGKIHSETREVYVPPQQRVANVEVLPSAEEYKPGEPAEVELKLTDLSGKPFVGSTVVSVYDKSVEYISGGPNVPEIRAYFWKWRRSHYPRTQSNLNRFFRNLLRSGEIGMSPLGAFGHLVYDDKDANEAPGMQKKMRQLGRGVAGPDDLRAAAPMEMEEAAAVAGDRVEGRDDAGAPSADQLVQPTVRTDFADTAFWAANVIADEDGIARVSFNMPENLTTWMVRVWAMGHGTRVGQGVAEVVTTKKLLVRLQAPRFFVERDEVVLSANVHNYLETAKPVRVVLELDGSTLDLSESPSREITVDAGGEQRVDWRVKVAQPGEAVIRVKALTDEESDAMQMHFPVRVHGMLKTESYTGSIRRDRSSADLTVSVPSQRRIDETRLEVRFSPTLAGAMVDALPYLVHYPYKTTDTTLHRFLPTVITQNILKRMNLDLEAIRKKRTNLNAQEIGDDRARAAGWKRYSINPVFDEREVTRMVKEGVKALTEMQLSDGGWGWFSGWGEHSDAHTTSQVVHGLQIAVDNDVALVPGVLERGVDWLKRHQIRQIELLENHDKKRPNRPWKAHANNLDALVYMVLVDAGHVDDRMHAYLYRDRTRLSVYALAIFGLALEKQGADDQLNMVVRNVDQFLVQDDENQTAWLRLPEGNYWWYWYGNETEANAYYLKLLARTDPQGERASRLVKYLLNNRKHATYWNSTRDTALAVEAMADYLQATGEHRPEMTVEIYFDGKKQTEVEIDAENLFSFDNKFVLTGDAVEAGPHRIELRKKGEGPLYYNAYLTYFSLEEYITRAGLELKVERKYYRLHREDKEVKVAGSRGQALDQRVEKYRREELVNLATLASGDLVEIELEIETKNDYEYLVFEDHKAAGFEPVEVRSGYRGNSLGAYLELGDERATFFIRRLPRGRHSVSFRVRAEIPGRFSALPTTAYAMYAPELKGNSDEIKLIIEDGPHRRGLAGTAAADSR